MAAPQTLLELAGLTPTPPPLTSAALVMIDCQREYVDGALPLAGVETALAEGARLLGLARDHGVPIIHVRHRGRPGGLFDPDGRAYEIAGPTAPEPGETVIDKALPNAFAGTELDEALKELGRTRLIVAGFMTHLCVSSTVRAALDLGYGCAVVAAACATRDLPDTNGGTVPAANVHRAELAALGDRFATIVADSRGLGTDG